MFRLLLQYFYFSSFKSLASVLLLNPLYWKCGWKIQILNFCIIWKKEMHSDLEWFEGDNVNDNFHFMWTTVNILCGWFKKMEMETRMEINNKKRKMMSYLSSLCVTLTWSLCTLQIILHNSTRLLKSKLVNFTSGKYRFFFIDVWSQVAYISLDSKRSQIVFYSLSITFIGFWVGHRKNQHNKMLTKLHSPEQSSSKYSFTAFFYLCWCWNVKWAYKILFSKM